MCLSAYLLKHVCLTCYIFLTHFVAVCLSMYPHISICLHVYLVPTYSGSIFALHRDRGLLLVSPKEGATRGDACCMLHTTYLVYCSILAYGAVASHRERVCIFRRTCGISGHDTNSQRMFEDSNWALKQAGRTENQLTKKTKSLCFIPRPDIFSKYLAKNIAHLYIPRYSKQSTAQRCQYRTNPVFDSTVVILLCHPRTHPCPLLHLTKLPHIQTP